MADIKQDESKQDDINKQDMEQIEPIEMNDPQDMVVREYLSAQLDGQVGRAEARFRRFLVEQQHASARPHSFRLPNRFRGWTLGLLGTALAASLAALWAGPSLRHVTPGNLGQAIVPAVTPVSNPILVEQDVQSQTFDDGTIMADDHTPVRVLRRRDVQRTRWFDKDQKLQGEQLAPEDHVVYVHVRTD
jgi:hypothetical protein